ncbi:MAG: diaminopropionate ammonia-lyase [Desulfobacterium sp. 4572_20]|nr:MAG: diaminopropionate ammonia-lyase [Desulfobacterium sp. 4572_20]HDH86490.1 diaminopropionate ammonia-lyase [Desulfobacteraceae bacterium]
MPEIEKITYIVNQFSRKKDVVKASTDSFSPSTAHSARKFHQTFPDYTPTPLVKLTHLADMLRVSNIWIKDESHRFGLNAFKVLGATHGLAYLLAQRLEMNTQELSFDLPHEPSAKEVLADTTLVTATDGNHGRAVAWAAQQLRCRAVVYLPKGASTARYESIKAHGAQTLIIDGTYDDAVKQAAEQAQKQGWILLQDTAREGYEEIPLKIMQGYLTILHEALEQLEGEIPTHVLVQCGVGSLAGASQAYLCELFGDKRPLFVVVEPTRAACFYEPMATHRRMPKKLSGNLNTIMAGLACGEPSALAWKILRDYADVFIACPDYIAMRGMRILGNPLQGDDRVISGESGAVTLGLLTTVLTQSSCRKIANALQLNESSTVLLISTEGDTDPSMYRKIVWG